MNAKCLQCKGELSEWMEVEEIGTENEKRTFRTMFECKKCQMFYEGIWELTDLVPWKREKWRKK